MSRQLLDAISQTAIERMSPYELADRATALRMGLGYNMLGIEPISTPDGTLFTVTSGLVASAPLGVQVEAKRSSLVRQQVCKGSLAVLADVVELRPPVKDKSGQALLYRVNQPAVARPAKTRAPFRQTINAAMQAAAQGERIPTISYGASHNMHYGSHVDLDEPAETRYISNSGFGLTPLLATSDSKIHVENIGADELDKEKGVRTSLSGPVRAQLDSHHLVRVTDDQIVTGPSLGKMVKFWVPEGTPTFSASRSEYERIPDNATITADAEGNLRLTGDRANDPKYARLNLNPSLHSKEAARLIPADAVDWQDVTDIFLTSLRTRIATVLPLDAAAAYERTAMLARQDVKNTLLAQRTAVAGGTGCLAVAARLAELPSVFEGIQVNLEYFQRAA